MRLPDRRLRQLVAVSDVVAVLGVLSAFAAIWLHHDNLVHRGQHSLWRLEFSDVIMAVVYPVAGSFLVHRRPRNPVSWIMAFTGLLGISLLADEYAFWGLIRDHDAPGATAAAWFAVWGWVPYLPVMTLLPMIFPDGRFLSRRWRVAGLATVGAMALSVAVMSIAPVPVDVSDELINPLGIQAAKPLLMPLFVALNAVGLFVGAPLGVVMLVVRMRRSRGSVRAQTQWLLAGMVVLVVGMMTFKLLPAGLNDLTVAIGLVAIPLSIAVGILRYGLLDIEFVLNRAVAYAVLSGLVIGAYFGVVELVGRLAPGERVPYSLIALIALAAAVGRDRVQRVVERLLFGRRRDPFEVVARVGGRLDLATGPLDALSSLVAELRDALKLPYVAVVARDSALPTISVGDPIAEVERLPVIAQGQDVGVLEVGHRHKGEKFRDGEGSVLTDVARRAGALVYAAALVDDLQRSRERIVAAREEERRRLRADLHDGLGPQLAGMALQLDSLAGRLAHDRDLAVRVTGLRDRMRTTVKEVRRLVDNLRPPAIDELGLVGALRQHVDVFGLVPMQGNNGDRPPVVTVHANAIPPLPAAVEVAAYRIATEAVTNAVRHANARCCEVRLAAEPDWLVVEVADDGDGISTSFTPGVGLASMQERVAELGGQFKVVVPECGGTVVSARLPLESDGASLT